MAGEMRRLSGGLAAAAIALLPAVALALSSNPDDPFYRAGDQWALSGNPSSTNAPGGWCSSTGSGIVIADIDTGADFSHPDLAGRLIRGASFTSGSGQPDGNPVDDDYGHGTMTTGLMVAATDNATGIASEAPGARALVIKVFSNKGGTNGYSAYNTDIAAAIDWAVQHGANVINLSLGPLIPLDPTDPIPAAVESAASHNVAVAISAGNGFADSGITTPGTPANYPQLAPYALVVGAMGPGGQIAGYSQSGAVVNIFAPGGDGPGGDPRSDILSTYPTYTPSNSGLPRNVNANGYAAYDGTSFSAPYAAGTLALLLATHRYTAAQARSRIIATAKSVGGAPVLDARAALGGCPAASAGGSTSSTGSTQPGPAAPPAAGKLPFASPPQAPGGLGQVAGAATGQPVSKPAAVRPGGAGRVPVPLAVALVVAGLTCIGGAAVWFARSRLFTQP